MSENIPVDLSAFEREHKEVLAKLVQPQNLTAQDLRALALRSKKLEKILNLAGQMQKIEKDLTHLVSLAKDAEMADLAKEEEAALTLTYQNCQAQLLEEIFGKEPGDERNVFLEIRAGVGGEEAALFARDLLRIYERYAARSHFVWELISLNTSGAGGVKEAISYVKGNNVYEAFKWESGVHRIQRVPQTEASGRVHTSTVTVAIMPEIEQSEIAVDPKDLRVDTYRAGGKGGQNVNKVETAIRITHIPTGLIVACQQERSQFQNREKAMNLLRAKLAQMQQDKATQELIENRRRQIQGGERSQKIRTYNILQSRITDHRSGESFFNIDEIFDGNLASIIESLRKKELTDKLSRLTHGPTT